MCALTLFAESQSRGIHRGEADIKTKWCNKTMWEGESAISVHCNFREQSESAKEEGADEEKGWGFRTGRLSEGMTDGWCKGKLRRKWIRQSRAQHWTMSGVQRAPLEQQGGEVSCAFWQWHSTGATACSAPQPEPYVTGHSAAQLSPSNALRWRIAGHKTAGLQMT